MSLFVLAVVVIMLAGVLVLGVVIVLVVSTARRQRTMTPSLPSTAPLTLATVETITQLRGSGRTLEAIRVLREATGMDLAQARSRVVGWSDVLELQAAQRHAVAPPDQVRIEASAILSTSGWHTAEAFLHEQRGFSPESAKALLDSLA